MIIRIIFLFLCSDIPATTTLSILTTIPRIIPMLLFVDLLVVRIVVLFFYVIILVIVTLSILTPSIPRTTPTPTFTSTLHIGTSTSTSSPLTTFLLSISTPTSLP